MHYTLRLGLLAAVITLGCDPGTPEASDCGGASQRCCDGQHCNAGSRCDAGYCVETSSPTDGAVCTSPHQERCDGVDSDCDGQVDFFDPDVDAACERERPGSTCQGSNAAPSCVCLGDECSGACVKLESDAKHCGVCGHACGAEQSCVEGRCDCPTGLTSCGTACVTPASDPDHCGSCGHACAETEDCVEAQCVARRSCPQGDASCRGESCCRALAVPGGQFPMGRSQAGTDAYAGGDPLELPEHLVTLKPFVLDKYEVTVGRYAEFLRAYDSWRKRGNPKAGAGASPNFAGSGWRTELGAEGTLEVDSATQVGVLNKCVRGRADLEALTRLSVAPRTCVSITQARAFCAWDGGWLPLEAEWEFVAAGGEENRLYPWGALTPVTGLQVPKGSSFGMSAPEQVGLTPLGDGRWGHADLAGSLGEHVVGTQSPYSAQGCVANCGVLPRSSDWETPTVVRGGAYWFASPDEFRCNRSAEDV